MKLSDAIREGIKQKPLQTRIGRFFEGEDRACALGCALVGVGVTKKDLPVQSSRYFPEIDDTAINPVTKTHDSLFGVVSNLNDDQGWTREQIADWLSEQGY